jgi:hypothetical protein
MLQAKIGLGNKQVGLKAMIASAVSTSQPDRRDLQEDCNLIGCIQTICIPYWPCAFPQVP